MFRLNGDIVKQLENIYGIKFNPKYKSELKNRILTFVSRIIYNEHSNTDLFLTLNNVSSFLIIENNKPTFISLDFLYSHQDALFEFFNPLWYNIDKPKSHNLSKSDIDKLTFNFIKESCIELSFLSTHNLSPFNYFSFNEEFYSFKFDIVYSPELYKKIYSIINHHYKVAILDWNDILHKYQNSIYLNNYNFYLDEDFIFSSFKRDVIKFSFSTTFFDQFLFSIGIRVINESNLNVLKQTFIKLFFYYEFLSKAKIKAELY